MKYLAAAKSLGNWLIRQQLPDGSWKETPEEWTGTTTDQLLMMVLAYQKLQARLSPDEADAWVRSMKKAADYLVRVMNPEFASINYCTTTTATLAMMNRYFPNAAHLAKARELARKVLAAMDEDGFIQAEGERVYNTSLYNFEAHLRLTKADSSYRVSASGELSDRKLLPGGVAYTLIHDFTGNELRKTVKLRYHGKKPQVDVVEPLVWFEGMRVARLDNRRLHILGPKREFLFEVTGGTATLEAGSPDATLFNVFPSIRCLPVYLHFSSPKAAISDQITYRIAIVK